MLIMYVLSLGISPFRSHTILSVFAFACISLAYGIYWVQVERHICSAWIPMGIRDLHSILH